jgi:phage gpG-like protein
MALSFKLTRNDISPALSRLDAGAKNPAPIYRAMGTTFKSITEGNFNSAGADYRPSPWPAKKDGTVSILQKSGALVHAFNLEVTNKYARLSNPMIYAAIHQFGARDHVAGVVVGTIKTKYANHRYAGSWNVVTKGGKGIPPRPYFPIGPDGKLTPKAEALIARAAHRALARQARS